MNAIKERNEGKVSTEAILRYSRITRYVLLRSLAWYNTSPKLDFIDEELSYHEFCDISNVVNILLKIFCDDFDKILESGDNICLDSEIEYAQFLLSRCKLLCLEPTYSSFLLVSAFLNNLVLRDGENLECFRIMYITEFCFLVLHRRFFWKIFDSKDGYQNLQKFCDEFHDNFTKDSTLRDLRKRTVGAKWINIVQNCVDASLVSFFLEDGEVKLFEEEYSKINDMECKSDHLREIESLLFPPCERSETEIFCKICDSKCHNYLVYVSQFCS
ncbi:hypothetical protein TNCT_179981 [Trichonephila clavata]|uniref:Uncharacterized protein n=1 Tax=Trichonephila clavata TaxID=2740835 RepID=A0A8X6KK60_TRICU|nr:hypothetical protein TNCT_179981 [Trichonephila clavata]